MPKLRCDCDTIINYGNIPAADEWLLISDIDFDQFSEEVNAEKLYHRFVHMLKCPTCQRLHIYWNGFTKSPTTYLVGDMDHKN